jgi:hypothetical protein
MLWRAGNGSPFDEELLSYAISANVQLAATVRVIAFRFADVLDFAKRRWTLEIRAIRLDLAKEDVDSVEPVTFTATSSRELLAGIAYGDANSERTVWESTGTGRSMMHGHLATTANSSESTRCEPGWIVRPSTHSSVWQAAPILLS